VASRAILKSRRLALLLPSVDCGGAERIMITLLRALADHGIPMDLVLGRSFGAFLSDVPSDVRIIELGSSRMRWAVPKLALYLRRERPYALLSRMSHANMAAICARKISGSDVRVVIVEASHLSCQIADGKMGRLSRSIMRRLYPLAQVIVGVSEGVARDLEQVLRLPPASVRTIYNPVVQRVAERVADAQNLHPWLQDKHLPVFLAVGRLADVKDYPTLLRAFALVLRDLPARLLILGEGPQRNDLQQLAQHLQVNDHFALPGYTANPYSALARADAFVLSSRYEGLPNAMIEALACGCPVVSTDCPSGPAEILQSGRYGELVPVGDVQSLAAAMLRTVERPISATLLRSRSAAFTLERALPEYLSALGYPSSHSKASAA
jgi:glycosyltransferase involved in cell wall biosynthesis